MVSTPQSTPKSKFIIYDGQCAICSRTVRRLRNDEVLVDSSSTEFNPLDYRLTDEEPQNRIYIVMDDGSLKSGMDALRFMGISASGTQASEYFWRATRLPGLSLLSEAIYLLFARNRRLLSRMYLAVKMNGLKTR